MPLSPGDSQLGRGDDPPGPSPARGPVCRCGHSPFRVGTRTRSHASWAPPHSGHPISSRQPASLTSTAVLKCAPAHVLSQPKIPLACSRRPDSFIPSLPLSGAAPPTSAPHASPLSNSKFLRFSTLRQHTQCVSTSLMLCELLPLAGVPHSHLPGEPLFTLQNPAIPFSQTSPPPKRERTLSLSSDPVPVSSHDVLTSTWACLSAWQVSARAGQHI